MLRRAQWDHARNLRYVLCVSFFRSHFSLNSRLAATHPILASELTKVKGSLLSQAKLCLDQKPSEAAKTSQKFKETKELMEKILKTYDPLYFSLSHV